MKNTYAFLPLEKFHIVKIKGLSPDELKHSAKTTKRDREKIPHTTLLNAIVKALGFKGGFSSYKSNHFQELKGFLKEHGLFKKANLFNPRKDGLTTLPKIKPQNLSERLFFSGLEVPKRVFTGYDYDYKNRMDDGNLGLIRSINENELPFGLKKIDSLNRDDIENNIRIVRETPNKIISRKNHFKNRWLIDVVLGDFSFHLSSAFNLLGDSLISPVKNNFEVTLYQGDLEISSLKKEKELIISMFELFKERIDQGEEGWLDLIPYNENLIFLKGRGGEYDFVFKNQRDQKFEHQIFGDALKRADIPSFLQDYHFLRWHYFEYKGWREKDYHEAENLFYQNRNHDSEYPGIEVLLMNFHKERENFCPDSNKSKFHHPNFFPVKACGKTLMVSNLISIEELDDFLRDRTDYLSYRAGEKITSANNENDYSLPAGLTWFDALAYIKWYEEQNNLPVRLLKYQEYMEIRGVESLLKPHDMSPTSNFRWYKRKSGLKYLLSNNFGEWLFEKTCIRTGNLRSFGNCKNVIRIRPPLDSSGTYKGMKIGFRLCYELDDASQSCNGGE